MSTTLLAGTADGLVELGVDGTRRQVLDGREVRCLVRGGDRWFALADDVVVAGGVGSDWREVAEVPDATALAVERDGALLIGEMGAALQRLHAGELTVLPGLALVRDAQHWHAVGSAEPYVRALAVADDALLAGVHVGGIPRSLDGGDTWLPTLDVDADVHDLVGTPDGRAFAACAVGLAVSGDAGATWSVEDEGLHATYCRSVALVDDAVLVGASTGPFSDQGAIYRWTPDDGRFERAMGGLPEWLPGNVDTDRLDGAGRLAAFGLGDAIWCSDDAGRSWTLLADDLPSVGSVALVTSRVAPRSIHARDDRG